jgi:hypothetical protein
MRARTLAVPKQRGHLHGRLIDAGSCDHRVVRLALLAVVPACGRIAFDPLSDAARDVAVDSPFTSGLIHYWPVDEAPGATVAVDMIGGANATLAGTATFVAGHNGNALFSGAGGFASVPATPADMLGRSQVTVSAWFKRAAPNGEEQVGQELMPGTDTISIQLYIAGNTYFCMGSPGACGVVPDANDTSWQLMTMVYDGTQPTDETKLVGYIDGVPQTLNWAYTLPVATMTPTKIGRFDLGATTDNEGVDTGTVDDVRVYDRALAPDEVQALFAGT